MINRFATWFLLLALLPAVGYGADGNRVLLVIPSRTALYGSLVQELVPLLENAGYAVEQLEIESVRAPATEADFALQVLVGSEVLEQMWPGVGALPTIATLVSGSAARNLLENAGRSLSGEGRLAILQLEQPPGRLVRLAGLVTGGGNRIGAVFDSSMEWQLAGLRAAVGDPSRLVAAELAGSDNPVRKLDQVLSASNVYLALPGPASFNQATAPWVVQLSLRRRVPVIGFSRPYVDAGALAAIFSTPEQIARQTAALVLEYLGGDRLALPAFVYPSEFTLEVNQHVARALGLALPPREQLEQQLLTVPGE